MQSTSIQLAKELAKECKTVDDVQAKLRDLFGQTIEQLLEAEIDEHLGYVKHSQAGDNSGNSRNGYSKKTLKTRSGKTEIAVPRDRNGEFEPQVIRKYKTTASELEDQIIAMYAKGLSTRDIEAHIRDIYGVNISPTLVSRITDKIMPEIAEWQSRPLEKVYPIVFLDAIHFKVRQDGRVINKAAYTVMALTLTGYKDILGIWIGENESASFWLSVCNDLHNRGVEDILIVAKDGLSGFSEAIKAVFPRAEQQLCIIHQIRNTLKYASSKNKEPLMADLKKVYRAVTLEQAEVAFEQFKATWGIQYPVIVRSWEKNWAELTTFFKYPGEIRRIIYTTNTIEGYHRQLRKATKTKVVYPSDDALRKVIYLATRDISKRWDKQVREWGMCLSQLMVYFGERLENKIDIL
jgi:transposase-like protein